jgi:hypothetical protein
VNDPDNFAPFRLTPVDHEELRATLASVWANLFGEIAPDDAIAILLAQSAFETNRWSACFNFNICGYKSTGAGLYTYGTTLEVLPRNVALRYVAASTVDEPCELVHDDGGEKLTVRFKPQHPVCRFRAYRSLGESVTGYVALLARRYLAAIEAAREGDVAAFVAQLAKGGYFTAPEDVYRRGVEALYEEYRLPCLSSHAELDEALGRLGYDGPTAVREFQAEHMSPLDVDGVAGPRTRRALREALRAAA